MYVWTLRNSKKNTINKPQEIPFKLGKNTDTKDPHAVLSFRTLRTLLSHNKITRKDLEKIDSKYPDHELRYKVKGTENTIWRVHVIC